MQGYRDKPERNVRCLYEEADVGVTDITVDPKEYEAYHMDSYLKPVWDGQVAVTYTHCDSFGRKIRM